MDFLLYLRVFATGGLLCAIGQWLINRTNMTSARILVIYLLSGIFLEAIGVFEYIADFGQSGARIPIIGFGSALAKGVITAVEEQGLLGIFTGGLSAAAGGIAAAVGFSFLFALIFSSKTKKC